MGVLRQAKGRVPVPRMWREHEICSANYDMWRGKQGGKVARMMARVSAERHSFESIVNNA